MSIIVTIAKKEHKAPSEIYQWCLPDIVYMFSSYIEEAQQMEEMNRELEQQTKNSK